MIFFTFHDLYSIIARMQLDPTLNYLSETKFILQDLSITNIDIVAVVVVEKKWFQVLLIPQLLDDIRSPFHQHITRIFYQKVIFWVFCCANV